MHIYDTGFEKANFHAQSNILEIPILIISSTVFWEK